MEQKILFFDIDNTLYDHINDCIPASTIEAIQRLKDNGHIVAIATGRGPLYINEMCSELEIDTYVGFNGNYVVLEDELISITYLNEKSVKQLHEFALENDIRLVYTGVDGYFTTTANDELIVKYYQEFNTYYPNVLEEIKDFSKFCQLTVMADEKQEEILKEKFPSLDFVRINNYGLNVLEKGGLKEKGIQKIMDILHFEKSNIICFGDGLNDIGMFEFAGVGVAMNNGHSNLKKIATYVTNDVDKDGIYNACLDLGLI